MASSARCFSSVALLALLLCTLFNFTSAAVYNYTAFFNSATGCSLTVGLDGSAYVGLCSQAHSVGHTAAALSLASRT